MKNRTQQSIKLIELIEEVLGRCPYFADDVRRIRTFQKKSIDQVCDQAAISFKTNFIENQQLVFDQNNHKLTPLKLKKIEAKKIKPTVEDLLLISAGLGIPSDFLIMKAEFHDVAEANPIVSTKLKIVESQGNLLRFEWLLANQ